MISYEDLKIDHYPSSTSGIKVGYPKGLKIFHEKSGITISIDNTRNPYAARQLMIEMLEEALTNPLINRVL